MATQQTMIAEYASKGVMDLIPINPDPKGYLEAGQVFIEAAPQGGFKVLRAASMGGREQACELEICDDIDDALSSAAIASLEAMLEARRARRHLMDVGQGRGH